VETAGAKLGGTGGGGPSKTPKGRVKSASALPGTIKFKWTEGLVFLGQGHEQEIFGSRENRKPKIGDK